MFAYILEVWKSLLRFCTQVSFQVTAIVWCCGDEGIYRQSLLSEYAFFIKHWRIHGKLTITLGSGEIHGGKNEQSFNLVHPKLWLVVEVPVDFIFIQIDLFAWSAIQFCTSMMA